MKKEIITQGATVEEAMANAAVELGLTQDKLTFEVLQEPQKKTLGLFGGTEAKVKAIYETSPAEKAEQFLKSILKAMKLEDVAVESKEVPDGCRLTLNGDDLGFLIGRRGDTLDALQHLIGLVGNRQSEDYFRVTLDIGEYRQKREQSLTGLAKKTGGQVARTGRRITLEAMNPYERRIIHTAVQGMKGVTSWSVGSEPDRRVVIGPEGSQTADTRSNNRYTGPRRDVSPRTERTERPDRPEHTDRFERPGRPDRYNNDRRNDRNNRNQPEVSPERPARQIREFVPRSNPMPTADGATPPSKTESKRESSASLYGRIDL